MTIKRDALVIGDDLPANAAGDGTAATGRRNALRLGLAASAFALSGAAAARAADSLTIEPAGVKIDNLEVAKNLTARGELTVEGGATLKGSKKPLTVAGDATVAGKLDFGKSLGQRVILYDPDYTLGIQPATMYFRTLENFAWYYGGEPDANVKLGAGAAKKAMSLSNNELTVAGPIKIDGKNVLEFGAGIKGKEISAGQIGYQAHSGDALDFVGAGTTSANRKIKLWAEGGATLTGSLTVTGNISIGTLSAAGGVEHLRMLRGIIKDDGTKVAGNGFTVARVADRGLYDITFDPGFPSVPGASATQIFGFFSTGNAPATNTGGSTTDNAVIAHLSADRMRVKTGDSGGSEKPRNFSFIVIGPR
ncbi:MAG TPA: hypothetical protein VGM07_11150 [Stellaceae bacterium]